MRKLHDLIAQRARLTQQLFDLGPLEARRPSQRRAQYFDFLDDTRVRYRRCRYTAVAFGLVEYLHAALNCFCTSW
ncbi:hypothetical protein BURKHO8Y_30286 [Burkholderia sp. 8Y]|nr:hypothetical protein BURKHO8Y_30286 [Burkholderia sp. 8Y]